MNAFGENLIRYREKKGFQVEDLSKKIDIPSSIIEEWENGKGYPSIDHLICIASILETDVNHLVYPQEKIPDNDTIKPVKTFRTVLISLVVCLLFAFSGLGYYLFGLDNPYSGIYFGLLLIIGALVLCTCLIINELRENVAYNILKVLLKVQRLEGTKENKPINNSATTDQD